jgi:hypothetical protein
MLKLFEFRDARFDRAIKMAVAHMCVALLLALLHLDFGALASQVAGIAVIYAVLVVVILCARHRATFGTFDIVVVKYAFLVLFVIVLAVDSCYRPFFEWFGRGHR